MMAKPIRALELHYPMIQFLIFSKSLKLLSEDLIDPFLPNAKEPQMKKAKKCLTSLFYHNKIL